MTGVQPQSASIKPVPWLAWLAIAKLGAAALGGIALRRGETINSLWFIVAGNPAAFTTE